MDRFECVCFQPIKICVLGPPASGKTTIAKQLAQEYKIHHLQIKDVIEETKNELVRARRVIEENEMRISLLRNN